MIKSREKEKKLKESADKKHSWNVSKDRRIADEKFKITLRQKRTRKKELAAKLNQTGLTKKEEQELATLRAMQKFNNRQMPVMNCSNCSFSNQCPHFKPDYECYFLPFLNSHKIETVDDILHYSKELVGQQMRRVHMMQLIETFKSGVPTMETTEAMQLSFNQLLDLEKRLREIDESNAESEENEIEFEGNQSMLGQIFGGLDNLVHKTRQAKASPIDTSFKTIQTEHERAKRKALEESSNLRQVIDEVREEQNSVTDAEESVDMKPVREQSDLEKALENLVPTATTIII